MSHPQRFADRLIAAQQVDAKRKERYEMELRQVLHQTLTPAKRVAYAVGAFLGLAFAVDGVAIAAAGHITGEYAAWGRAAFAAFAVFGLVWAFLAGRIALRGTLDLRGDRTAIARLLWCFSVLVFVVVVLAGALNLRYGSGRWPAFAAVIALAYLIAAALFVVRNVVQQAELRIREKLLDIELRVAELDEGMRKDRG